ncbi:MAG: 4-hydroxy-tetrahydrodipicolinate reductase [Treponema sp.]|nr:4-hydroxy-tetrahydrodipicolinate reductase [Treponema sp.]
MRLCLAGYGKMGKMIEKAALERGHQISLVIDPHTPDSQTISGAAISRSFPPTTENAGNPDLFIEFTLPDTAPENIKAAIGLGKPVLSGTTGWHDHLAEVSNAVEKAGTALLWSSNFSLGVNLFYRIAAHAAQLMDPFAEYDLGGLEIHHNKKADYPSGTARTLMEQVLAAMKRKTRVHWGGPPSELCKETARGLPRDLIHFASLRQGSAPGVHSLFFDSPADTIEITHTARSREGFASGAIIAAEWLAGTENNKARRGIFTMEDVLKDMLPYERI